MNDTVEQAKEAVAQAGEAAKRAGEAALSGAKAIRDAEVTKKASKVLKIVAIAAGSLVALILLLVLTLPLWLGPIFRPSVNAIAPTVTKTPFNIGHLWLNPYTGRFEVGDVVIGNPAGYAEPVAIAFSNLVVDADMATVCRRVIHLEEVTFEDCFVSYVKGGENGVDNLTQIQYNIAGGKEKFEANLEQSRADKAKAQERADEAAREAIEAERARRAKMTDEEREAYDRERAAQARAAEGASRQMVIDRLVVRGIRFKYGMITVPIPDITLTDLGKQSEGVTFSEVMSEIGDQIMNSALKVGDSMKAFGRAAGAAAGSAGESLDRAVESVNENTTKAVDAIKGLFK